jgi:diguanylate cyclase (GGDEF)-like protein/PAS domain S-box-containing protein
MNKSLMPRFFRRPPPLSDLSGTPQKPLRTALILMGLVCGIDVWMPRGVSLAPLYVLPVLISVWSGRRLATLSVAAGASLLAPIGLWTAFSAGMPTVGLSTSGLRLLESIELASDFFVIWVTAALGVMRIESERQLSGTRGLTAIALESSADGIVTTDPDGLVLILNPVAEKLSGWNESEARGRHLDEVLNFEAEKRDGSGIFPPPTAARRRTLTARDGHRQPVDVSVAPLLDPSGISRGSVIVVRDASDSVAYERRLRDLAFRDRLTGLPNRASLLERLDLELAHARRSGSSLALLFMDLDGFKAVNDELGHQAGDELLRAVAQRLLGCLREADTVARLGGDEFTVLVPGIQDARGARAVASKLLEALAKPLVLSGRLQPIRPSIGVALFPSDASDGDGLLHCADQAMYAAKRSGGARFHFFGRENTEAAQPRTAAAQLPVPRDG